MRSPSFFSYLIVYAVMFEQIGYTQANGTIYLHERDEYAVLLHRENSGVVLMGSSARPTGPLASGTKRQKNALIVDSCGFGCTHVRLHEDVSRDRAAGDDYFRLELFPWPAGNIPELANR
ncbi:hypothetical protein DW661_08040 [Collinsella sp. AM24-1]|nr:hypothetical protein DXD56_03615 [Collinsella sp. TM06-3]RHF70944.1 hypothetical protein DW661_08040 [Collinsella sp. AM24-1]RHL01903.1 hypothetical protein DW037_09990 [Collinsella sp. AF39-11AT]RHM64013.1 hypothetical protein DWZ52_02080 [Collinsella sp. AF33-16]RHN34573.1 hypothetical protein DWZ15_09975 [Collinsella sp. AF29-7AC]